MLHTESIVNMIKSGNVGVLPTDTLYGLVGSALSAPAVEKIFDLKKRTTSKPPIILIGNLEQLELFHITLSIFAKNFLKRNWPNPLSVVLPCPRQEFRYLHRGTNTLAFRMPKSDMLLELLNKAGPLIAPSANPEGQKPAETIDEAKQYFGDSADFYLDRGKLSGLPSTLISIDGERVAILREGAAFSLET